MAFDFYEPSCDEDDDDDNDWYYDDEEEEEETINNYSDVAVVNNQGSYMKVFSQVLGQVKADELELSAGTTVGMLKTKLNLANTFIAKVSGLDANDNTELKEWSVVLWSEKTKGN